VGQAHRVESESEEPVIRVDFDRSAATASAVGMVWRSPEGAEPIYPLARLLADRGFRGPAIFYDERGMACITVRCIAAMAPGNMAEPENSSMVRTNRIRPRP
jgi:hypothetical protein